MGAIMKKMHSLRDIILWIQSNVFGSSDESDEADFAGLGFSNDSNKGNFANLGLLDNSDRLYI